MPLLRCCWPDNLRRPAPMRPRTVDSPPEAEQYSVFSCNSPLKGESGQLASVQVHSFSELLALRVGFAAAQATQNPLCFSLIPELFPRERTTAMAAYNAAIYVGRALSFAAVIIAGQASFLKCPLTASMYEPGALFSE